MVIKLPIIFYSLINDKSFECGLYLENFSSTPDLRMFAMCMGAPGSQFIVSRLAGDVTEWWMLDGLLGVDVRGGATGATSAEDDATGELP